MRASRQLQINLDPQTLLRITTLITKEVRAIQEFSRFHQARLIFLTQEQD